MKKILIAMLAVFSLQCSKSQENNQANPMAEKALSLVNAYRSKSCNCGANNFAAVPEVKLNAKLTQAAQAHSDYMLEHNQMTHYGKDKTGPNQRLAKVGYKWATYAENVASGYPNEESVIKGWMESPGHCANIMNPQVTEMGIARSGNFWTIVLAAPR